MSENAPPNPLPCGCGVRLVTSRHEVEIAHCPLHAAAGALLEALEDLLPYAEQEIKRLTERMTGSLYPAINAAKLERARAAVALARGADPLEAEDDEEG